jgi:hypothetical protein
MLTEENGINRTIFWIVAGVASLSLIASGVLVATRTNGKKATVLGKTLKSPTPAANPTEAPVIIVTLPPAAAPAPAPAPSPTEAAAPEPAPTEAAAPPPASAPTLVCHNSTDSRCGRFFWSPSPGANKPIDIQVTWSPESPVAGDVVTFWVKITDADAKITDSAAGYGDPRGASLPACATPVRYGPWSPPARQAGSLSLVFHHAYAAAGDYNAIFLGRSGACGSPYGADVSLRVPITVQEEPSPEPEPTSSPYL